MVLHAKLHWWTNESLNRPFYHESKNVIRERKWTSSRICDKRVDCFSGPVVEPMETVGDKLVEAEPIVMEDVMQVDEDGDLLVDGDKVSL